MSGDYQASRTRRSAIKAHALAVRAGSAGRPKSSPSASNAEGGGHRASRTRGSAVKAHAHCADWLGMAADEQHQREQ